MGKAKKAKKKLKKILDAKNFVNEALKKEKGALEDRKAKISANIKDYKDQKNAKRIARANLNIVNNHKNDTTESIPTDNSNTSTKTSSSTNTSTKTSTKTSSNTSINNTARPTKRT